MSLHLIFFLFLESADWMRVWSVCGCHQVCEECKASLTATREWPQRSTCQRHPPCFIAYRSSIWSPPLGYKQWHPVAVTPPFFYSNANSVVSAFRFRFRFIVLVFASCRLIASRTRS